MKNHPARRSSPFSLFVFVVMAGVTHSALVYGQGQSPSENKIENENGAACASWPRVLPPVGLDIPDQRRIGWEERIAALETQLADHRQSIGWADTAVLTKACQLAIQFREFYQEKDFAKCDRLLALAEERIKELGKVPTWTTAAGLQVRGFQSRVDGSVQPVGLIIPEKLGEQIHSKQAGANVPLFVWLHGRGDKATDIHFLCDRIDKKGEVAPDNAITLHPFGRHCVGYKSAGSTDVMEAIDFACANYPIDQRKIVLVGFSMGGAGAWHLAAHYTDRFVAASPGAGFAETARYQNLKPSNFPPKYEQMLWAINDVPGYTRNLFNIEVIAYSGEIDKQIQAARVMEEAYAAEGRKLEHLIGPGMGHKYHPEVLKDLLSRLSSIAAKGKPTEPNQLTLQTRHLQFAERDWIRIDGVQTQYADTRVDAVKRDESHWNLETKNVTRLELTPPAKTRLTIDGSAINSTAGQSSVKLDRDPASGQWRAIEAFPAWRKHPGMSGPIDDAFYSPFLFVMPSGQSASPNADRWIRCEMQAAVDRWKALMRGEPRVKLDTEVTDADRKEFHLVLWGDPSSNRLIAEMLKEPKSPLIWTREQIRLGDERWDGSGHMPALIVPNPVIPDRYIVINSGLTFRDAHDRTNSLQNPHLPDWVIFSLDEPPSAASAGRVVAAGFFDDRWQFDKQLSFFP